MALVTQPRTPITLESTHPLGRDHLAARFRAPAGFGFMAGQWGNLFVTAPGSPAGGPPDTSNVRRALSFASSPHELPRLELCVRRRPDSLACTVLEQAPPGSGFELEGPFGAFVWTPHEGPILAVATSAGIAPIRSILFAASEGTPFPHEVVLLHAVACDRDPPYAEEASRWRALLPRLAITHRRMAETSDETDPSTWTSVVEEAFAHANGLATPKERLRVYLAGHGAMIQPLRERLRRDLALERNQVKAEIFWP